MINYNKNKLINKALEQYYETFSHTLDTADFVPQKFNDKINKYIYKNMKKALKKIDKEDKIFQKKLLKTEKNKQKLLLKAKKEQKKSKKLILLTLISKFILWIKYRKLKRKHRLLTYNDDNKTSD